MKLLVVAGHGKKPSGVMDNGAGGSGYTEAERVRALANRMRALGGNSVILGDQSKKWLDYGLYNTVSKSTFDCAIELHMDSSASSAAKGGHVIIKSGFSADKYDKALESFIKSYFPGRSSTMVGRNDLGVVNSCANRGINFRLLEVCFISNPSDISKFNNNVDTVAKGILSAFGITASGSSSSGLSSGANSSGGSSTGSTPGSGGNSSYTGSSIVDYLNSIGADSSYSNRTKLAAQYGIANYSGTAAQNTTLLNKMRSGSAGVGTSTATSSAGYYQAFTSSSIVDGLKSIGVDSSMANRKKIAGVNGISNYSGTAAQNITLLGLAKSGKLKKV